MSSNENNTIKLRYELQLYHFKRVHLKEIIRLLKKLLIRIQLIKKFKISIIDEKTIINKSGENIWLP